MDIILFKFINIFYNYMKTYIFIDILGIFTNNMLNEGCGASEFQEHCLAKYLALNNRVLFFSRHKKNEIINNVEYLQLEELKNKKYNIENAILIIQRMVHLLANFSNNKRMPLGLENFDLRNYYKNNKIIIWCHDFITSGLIIGDYIINDKDYYSKENLINCLENLNKNNNLKIVCVSNYQKDKFLDLCNKNDYVFNENKIKVIYNGLYEDYFEKKNYIVNKYQLCFISSWFKGIKPILDLFDELLLKNNNYVLYLASPGYDSLCKNEKYINEIKEKYKDNIKIILKTDKLSLSKIIGESLCLIGPKFEETFGCVYQESYYLNTPVIADYSSGAPIEIINKDSFIDYKNKNDFVFKVISLNKNRENVFLKNELFCKETLIEWDNLFNTLFF